MTKIPRGAYVRIGGRRQKLSPGRAKYNTALEKKDKPTEDGFIFDSLVELKYYQELKLRKMAGEIKEFEVKVKYYIYTTKTGQIGRINLLSLGCTTNWTFLSGKKPEDVSLLFTYTPDVVVDDELVDVKSPSTEKNSTFRLKARMLKALGLPIKVVK